MHPYISKEMRRYNYLSAEISSAYHEMSRKLGLSDSAMMILYSICTNGGSCLLQEICRQSGVRKQTINSAIRKLEAEGIIYLEPIDAKSKAVCLTDRGKQLAPDTAGQMIQAENEIFESWSVEDRETYLELTERYLTALQEKTKRIKERNGY